MNIILVSVNIQFVTIRATLLAQAEGVAGCRDRSKRGYEKWTDGGWYSHGPAN